MIISSAPKSMKAEFIRQVEAGEVAKEASDLITSQLVDSAVASAIALTPIERKQWPIADFDMNLNLFSERNDERLRVILDGEHLRWWNDEYSEGHEGREG